MTRIIMSLIVGAALVACLFFYIHHETKASYARGKADATLEFKQQQINDLATVITQTQALVDHAESVSQQIEAVIANRQTADQKTTKEIQHALKQTSASRANCKFDDSIMQQLTAARDRANQAAATGISYPVPTSTSTD